MVPHSIGKNPVNDVFSVIARYYTCMGLTRDMIKSASGINWICRQCEDRKEDSSVSSDVDGKLAIIMPDLKSIKQL